MSWRQLPNIVTVLRFLLAIPVTMTLLQDAYMQALLLFALAGFSDALDGFLARRFDWFTRLGSLLDPLADKVLLVATFTVLTVQGHLSLSFLCVVLGRDLAILVGASAYHFLIGRFVGQPTKLSKVCTFLQILFGITLVMSLAGYGGAAVANVLVPLQIAVVISCVASGLHYVVLWGWRTRAQVGRMVASRVLVNHKANSTGTGLPKNT
jgi:cardiolipin synthase